eukprot:14060-Pelagococcus_subviridis.AAC.2
MKNTLSAFLIGNPTRRESEQCPRLQKSGQLVTPFVVSSFSSRARRLRGRPASSAVRDDGETRVSIAGASVAHSLPPPSVSRPPRAERREAPRGERSPWHLGTRASVVDVDPRPSLPPSPTLTPSSSPPRPARRRLASRRSSPRTRAR